jgi:uncharacterized protein (TIGR00299 family) protein
LTKTVLIDVSTAGASGDMFLAALIDLLDDDDAIVPVAASLLIYDPTLRVKVVSRSDKGQSGRQLQITSDQNVRFGPKSLIQVLDAVAEEIELSKHAKDIAERALNEILEAESRAHETPLEELHLHETGSVDTILDIVGTAYLLDKANLLEETDCISTKAAVGKGTIKTEHGELEVPVPAVSEILVANDALYHTGEATTEVLTPTGAAILVSLAERYIESSEAFVIEKEGIGFGQRSLGKVTNSMKILVGELAEEKPAKKKEREPTEKVEAKPKKKEEKILEMPEVITDWSTDEVVVIESTIDDADGEVIGTIYDTLLSEGLAYQVVMIPAYGKKNRPCFIAKVVAEKSNLNAIAERLVTHLGTLGVRYTTWDRFKASREVIVTKFEIDDTEFMVRVKISRASDGSIVNIKPEADDIIKISLATGIPLRELKPRITMQAKAITE